MRARWCGWRSTFLAVVHWRSWDHSDTGLPDAPTVCARTSDDMPSHVERALRGVPVGAAGGRRRVAFAPEPRSFASDCEFAASAARGLHLYSGSCAPTPRAAGAGGDNVAFHGEPGITRPPGAFGSAGAGCHALERAVQEGLHPLVDLGAEPAHLADPSPKPPCTATRR
jgi:hypothetical protein